MNDQIKYPAGWKRLADPFGVGAFCALTPGGLKIIATVDEIDGREWLHASVSRKSRVPTYDDLCIVKQALVGPDAVAYQMFPKKTEHVSNHDFCLHLWAPRGFDPFPDVLGERSASVGIKGLTHAQTEALAQAIELERKGT